MSVEVLPVSTAIVLPLLHLGRMAQGGPEWPEWPCGPTPAAKRTPQACRAGGRQPPAGRSPHVYTGQAKVIFRSSIDFDTASPARPTSQAPLDRASRKAG